PPRYSAKATTTKDEDMDEECDDWFSEADGKLSNAFPRILLPSATRLRKASKANVPADVKRTLEPVPPSQSGNRPLAQRISTMMF
ncbi:hypothetical protein MMC31_006530, partial [Peltigera leucophlebia]|nr:hypothetical protein [Peltigera leucophlebia]